jgi:hypothetical protein
MPEKGAIARSQIEIVTDQARVAAAKERPIVTLTTGIGETYHIKINQPTGRALLIAVHL